MPRSRRNRSKPASIKIAARTGIPVAMTQSADLAVMETVMVMETVKGKLPEPRPNLVISAAALLPERKRKEDK